MDCWKIPRRRYSEIHMLPEQTAQAAVDLKTELFMPIHWGAFKLAFHPWKDPAERVARKSNELGIPVVIPQIGEPLMPTSYVDPEVLSFLYAIAEQIPVTWTETTLFSEKWLMGWR